MTLRLHLNEHTGGCSPIVEQALRAMTRVDTACYPDEAPATRAAERWWRVWTMRLRWVLIGTPPTPWR
jgi:hypothetical protein